MRKTNLAVIGVVTALTAAAAIATDASPTEAPGRLQPAVIQGDTAQLVPAQYYYTRRVVVVRHRYHHYWRPYYARPYYYGYRYPYWRHRHYWGRHYYRRYWY